MRRRDLLIGAAALSWVGAAAAQPSTAPIRDGIVVVGALAPVCSIAARLLDGANARIMGVPPSLPGMARVARALARPTAETEARLARADAVLTLASVWPDDPLFREARARTIRIVEIDAARSFDAGGPTVAQIPRPVTDVPWRPGAGAGRPVSPHVWSSIANVLRMADVMARDLARLSPGDAPVIVANQNALVATLRALKTRTEAMFADLDAPHLLSLSDRFPYLLDELAIDVDANFVEEDARWTVEDHRNLGTFLAERRIRTVVHHWQPSEAVAATIRSAGAALLLLDDGDTWEGTAAADRPPRDIVDLLRANIDALHGALS